MDIKKSSVLKQSSHAHKFSEVDSIAKDLKHVLKFNLDPSSGDENNYYGNSILINLS